MSIFPFGIFQQDTSDEMAKKGQIDDGRVAAYAARLTAAGSDSYRFEDVLAELKADAGVSAAEMQVIAVRYRGGGKKPHSKSAAVSAIVTRFAEISRFHRNNAIAEKVRPL